MIGFNEQEKEVLFALKVDQEQPPAPQLKK